MSVQFRDLLTVILQHCVDVPVIAAPPIKGTYVDADEGRPNVDVALFSSVQHGELAEDHRTSDATWYSSARSVTRWTVNQVRCGRKHAQPVSIKRV